MLPDALRLSSGSFSIGAASGVMFSTVYAMQSAKSPGKPRTWL